MQLNTKKKCKNFVAQKIKRQIRALKKEFINQKILLKIMMMLVRSRHNIGKNNFAIAYI